MIQCRVLNLGPSYDENGIKQYLDSVGADYTQLQDDQLFKVTAKVLEDEKVIGWFAGRMEFGPRALGGRSIIGDARSKKMQSVMNLKIKYREYFRPFAPSIKHNKVSDWFEHAGPSPYMLIVAPVREDKGKFMTEEEKKLATQNSLYSPKALRAFGLIMASMLILMFGFVLPWLFNYSSPYWPFVAAVIFVVLTMLRSINRV